LVRALENIPSWWGPGNFQSHILVNWNMQRNFLHSLSGDTVRFCVGLDSRVSMAFSAVICAHFPPDALVYKWFMELCLLISWTTKNQYTSCREEVGWPCYSFCQCSVFCDIQSPCCEGGCRTLKRYGFYTCGMCVCVCGEEGVKGISTRARYILKYLWYARSSLAGNKDIEEMRALKLKVQ